MSKSPSGKRTSSTASKEKAVEKPLSRSEIEEALATKRKADRTSKRKPKPVPNTDSTILAPRRQNVIGGDLSGVASRPKSLWMKTVEMGVVNWIVLVMIIAIVGAFIWPQGDRGVVEVQRSTTGNDSGLIETDTDDLQETSSGVLAAASGFSRDNDIVRADEYRLDDAKELQVKDLLERAAAMVTSGNYTQPPEANAVAAYNAILTLDPNNFQAKQGLEYILDRFRDLGFSELEQANIEAARKQLANLAEINPQAPQTLDLSQAIEFQNQQNLLTDFLAKAESALARDDLILPAKDNALYFYQQILLIDDQNSQAQSGIQSIADSYIEKANQAVIRGELQTANAHLATVSIIDPEHESISLIEAMISNAQKRNAKVAKSSSKPRSKSSRQETVGEERRPSREPSKSASTEPTSTSTARDTKTPEQQSQEQAAFDRQYLKQGLDAYYRGDYANAAALLQPLADKGIARAQFRLAYMHFLGRGFDKSKNEADRIIRAALPAVRSFAEEGRAWAQSDLGSLYEDGLVLKRDYGEAVYWYRSAAEQGYPGAQTNLGIMYARGLGVSASRKTAIEWFQRAAKQGDESAKRNLQALGAN